MAIISVCNSSTVINAQLLNVEEAGSERYLLSASRSEFVRSNSRNSFLHKIHDSDNEILIRKHTNGNNARTEKAKRQGRDRHANESQFPSKDRYFT